MTVIVDGEEYNVPLVNGTALINTGNMTNVTVVVNGKKSTTYH